jgi:hypothetical protein
MVTIDVVAEETVVAVATGFKMADGVVSCCCVVRVKQASFP